MRRAPRRHRRTRGPGATTTTSWSPVQFAHGACQNVEPHRVDSVVVGHQDAHRASLPAKTDAPGPATSTGEGSQVELHQHHGPPHPEGEADVGHPADFGRNHGGDGMRSTPGCRRRSWRSCDAAHRRGARAHSSSINRSAAPRPAGPAFDVHRVLAHEPEAGPAGGVPEVSVTRHADDHPVPSRRR